MHKWFELTLGLGIKDLKNKYRNASGGFAWMVVSPLAQMGVFYFVFGYIFKINIEGYPLFLLCGLLPWGFLRGVIDSSANSVLSNAQLIRKTRFPRQALPISTLLSNLAPFLGALLLLIIVSLILRPSFNPMLLWLVVIVILQIVLLGGISLMVAGLNAVYRETQFIIEIVLMIWFYFTPIIYDLSMVERVLPRDLFIIYRLNPMAGIISAYHAVFVHRQMPDLNLLFLSGIFSCCIFLAGWVIFADCERKFEDLI